MRCSKSSSKREVYSNTILPQETRKTSNRQPNSTPKTTRKRSTKQPKISRRKEILTIQAEINQKEMKEMVVKIHMHCCRRPGKLVRRVRETPEVF